MHSIYLPNQTPAHSTTIDLEIDRQKQTRLGLDPYIQS